MRFHLLLIGLIVPAVAWNGEVVMPHEFVAGEKAIAAEVNENFSTLSNEVNDNNIRIDANETSISTNATTLSSKQNRVTETCEVNSSIRAINDDGTVICEADDVGISAGGDITAVNTAAGSGLSGGVTEGEANLAVDTAQIQSAITGSCPNGEAMQSVNADGTLVCTANRNYVLLPDGETSVKYAYISKPRDYGGGDVTVTPIFGECNGSSVELGFNSGGFNLGNNIITILPPEVSRTLAIDPPSGFAFVIASTDFDILASAFKEISWFYIKRIGNAANDTCESALRLYGVRVDYLTTSADDGRIFIPAHLMTNQ